MKKLTRKHKENIILVIIILLGMWSLTLQYNTKKLMKDTEELSNEIVLISQEQERLEKKLDDWMN